MPYEDQVAYTRNVEFYKLKFTRNRYYLVVMVINMHRELQKYEYVCDSYFATMQNFLKDFVFVLCLPAVAYGKRAQGFALPRELSPRRMSSAYLV